MANPEQSAYAGAGVDIKAGYEGVRRMAAHVSRTTIPGVLSELGGFGGLFAPNMSGMREPVLVSGADGVGTKLRIAQRMGRHDTVGIDCVAMCVNDILCCGARPIFFLDYIAIGKNDPATVEALVSGVAEGCVQSGCALLGGETAEHPGVMNPTDYDLAGFAVGLVDKPKLLDITKTCPGDKLIALPSSGLHANGFSLVRKIFDVERADLSQTVPELNAPLGETLLTPTRIYVKAVLAALDAVEVHGISHITGGGYFENIPRAIPKGLGAVIEKSAVSVPPVFRLVQSVGRISERDMYATFNMGIGMLLTVPPEQVAEAIAVLRETGESPVVVGEIRENREGVTLV